MNRLTITITIRIPKKYTYARLQPFLDDLRDKIFRMLPDLEIIPGEPPITLTLEDEK